MHLGLTQTQMRYRLRMVQRISNRGSQAENRVSCETPLELLRIQAIFLQNLLRGEIAKRRVVLMHGVDRNALHARARGLRDSPAESIMGLIGNHHPVDGAKRNGIARAQQHDPARAKPHVPCANHFVVVHQTPHRRGDVHVKDRNTQTGFFRRAHGARTTQNGGEDKGRSRAHAFPSRHVAFLIGFR